MVNAQRLKQNLEEISKFGALEGGGLTRLAFSKEEEMAKKYLINLAKNAGLEVQVDGIGNIFATLKGGDSNLPPVATGSHLDSVKEGGFYDGPLGVICSLEALQTIKEKQIPHLRDITLVVFSCEESSRFNHATVGSKTITKKLNLSNLKEIKDKSGISIYQAAKSCRYDIDNLENQTLKDNQIYAFLELHIEQGPVLEAKQIPVGIVTGIASPIRYELTLNGRADHSGATPMSMRKDALVCASEIIIAIEKCAKAYKTAVGTVGFVEATPGVLNVIPGSARLGIDLRDICKDDLIALDKDVTNAIKQICSNKDISYELKELSRSFPVKLSEKIIKTLENEALNLGIKTLNLPSGAGHDTMNLDCAASHIGMIFIPCKDGISHNVKESIKIEDSVLGANLLTKTIITLSNEV
ncbi:M20 family metallo-hydrolase [Campylobacter geochelonis]|uniref:M20 family metallo-hydrolase n=1 Tax=Campylobacter geochelonis TaxID=1780362 RepID=UPI000770838A|nr:M20 family metallo-hydrolase [Campylobacter geochelonis]CZE47313.1 N-carbamoyl-L-amino acid hydrolase [Campylobacter geochelonis]